uniref:Uncharacterized protein n=1 Tax=Arundo donax TaxID=35708 RepID=A0A0A9EY02_ARUDO
MGRVIESSASGRCGVSYCDRERHLPCAQGPGLVSCDRHSAADRHRGWFRSVADEPGDTAFSCGGRVHHEDDFRWSESDREADILPLRTRCPCDYRTHRAATTLPPVFHYCTAYYIFSPTSYAVGSTSGAASTPLCVFTSPSFYFGTPSFASYFLRRTSV